MRAPTDMPRRRRRGSNRARVVLIVVVAALFLLATSLRGIAGFYTDYLWFDSLDLAGVWRGVIGAQVALAVIFTAVFFILLLVNLWIADRIAPRFRPRGPEEDLLERYHSVVGRRQGLVRAGIALAFALLFGLGASSQWREWILFTNSVPFGEKDPLFDTDISFYVFRLPFLSYLVNWLFASLIIILLITAVAHYLNGGIRLQNALQRVTPQVKAHLSVLLGLLALVKAADYWLQRYELTVSTRGTVDGATYTDVNAQLPAIYLLLSISLLAFVLFILNIWRRGWVLPVVTVGLWAFAALVVGTLYPTFVQRFRVEPAESSKEEPYIARNIEATRAAMGLDNVESESFDYEEELTAEQLQANAGTISNIRLLDPQVVTDTYQRLQEQRSFYQFVDLDVDRYTVEQNGEEVTSQVVLSTRDLNTAGVPQQSWEGQHLAFTHGYGLALAPSNVVTESGRPDFLIRNVPVVVDERLPETVEVTQPQVYFSEGLGGYAIVNTEREEIDYTDEEGEPVPNESIPDGGVLVGGTGAGGFARRAAFALRFGEIEPLISNFVTADSRIFYVRDIRERVEKLAPFLSIDADPYPVVSPDGQIFYMLDAYTTTDRYPYGQRASNEQLPEGSDLAHNFNYIRNSVKVVVDAYTGDVTFYLMPGTENADGEVQQDPIARAYANAFPELFEEFEEMPEFLQDHVRYPEDLFRVQTNMWSRYHITEPTPFYEQAGAWSVAQDPGTAVNEDTSTPITDPETGQQVASRQARIAPYYLQMQLPGEPETEFVLLRSFVPFSENDERKELSAFMIAQSDPEDYGRLSVYQMPTEVDGPAIVQSNISQTTDISREITLLNQQGSEVAYGNLILVPIDRAILYVRPVYVQAASGSAVPELERVIVAFGGQVTIGDNLLDALLQIFDEPDEAEVLTSILGAELTPPTDPDEGEETPTDGEEGDGETPPADVDATVQGLLEEADQLLADAERALAEDGDLGAYQDKVQEATEKVNQALDLAAGGDGSGGGETSGQPDDGAGTEGDGTDATATTVAPDDG